jgi:hypothetical protein
VGDLEGAQRRLPDLRARLPDQSALPRLVAQTVVGAGFVWFPSDRLSVFGNWGAATDRSGPATTFQVGLANSF